MTYDPVVVGDRSERSPEAGNCPIRGDPSLELGGVATRSGVVSVGWFTSTAFANGRKVFFAEGAYHDSYRR